MTNSFVTARVGADARGEPRRAWPRRAVVLVEGQPRQPARTIDISISGLSLMTERPVPLNARCGICISFLRGEVLSQIEVAGNAVYSILVGTKGYRTGIQFTQIDSATRALISQIVHHQE